MFSLQISDLCFELKCQKLDNLFYAYDLILGCRSKCQLQQSLIELYTYCGRNCLKINVNKTKCMKSRRDGRLAVDEKFYMSNREVEFTNICYLGVFFKQVILQSSFEASNKFSLLVSFKKH